MKAAVLSLAVISFTVVAGCSGETRSPEPNNNGPAGSDTGGAVSNPGSTPGGAPGQSPGNAGSAGSSNPTPTDPGSTTGGTPGQGGTTGGDPPVSTVGADGFATVEGNGVKTTTGGEGGQVVTVSTTDEFLDYIARPEPYVVQVSGTITLPTGTTDGMHDVTSNKTILGLGADATLVGGGLKIGLPVDNAITSPPPDAVHNIIIRNLKIVGASDDLINIQMFSHHIWIDHCDLSDGGDGALDIKRGSDLITVSWNHFHDHTKTCLLGHDELGAPQDIGRLRVTYHHNFFDRSDQRNPRVRFAEPVHVYNNYYNENSYGIASTWNAGVVAEGNYFFSVNNPGRVIFEDNQPGRMIARENTLIDCHHEIEVAGPVVEPSTYYPYTLDKSAHVPAIVMAGAGVGKGGARGARY